jgi:hypothetical protein
MKCALTASVFAFLLVALTASAQQPIVRRIEQPRVTVQPGPHADGFTAPQLTVPVVTPELWIYSQEQRRHDDPAQAVRRKAEVQADQRISRLSAMKWYGLSNSRPQASPIPTMGVYSPGWVGNGWNRYDWMPVGTASMNVYLNSYPIAR